MRLETEMALRMALQALRTAEKDSHDHAQNIFKKDPTNPAVARLEAEGKVMANTAAMLNRFLSVRGYSAARKEAFKWKTDLSVRL